MTDNDLTRNQSLVLGKLTGATAPKSAYDLLDDLREDGIKAPLQIYRALEKLTERGLAHRLESLNAFVACSEPHCHRTGFVAFAICEQCGSVSEFSDEVVKQRVESWAQTQGFVPSHATIEIRGLCAACAKAV